MFCCCFYHPSHVLEFLFCNLYYEDYSIDCFVVWRWHLDQKERSDSAGSQQSSYIGDVDEVSTYNFDLSLKLNVIYLQWFPTKISKIAQSRIKVALNRLFPERYYSNTHFCFTGSKYIGLAFAQDCEGMKITLPK